MSPADWELGRLLLAGAQDSRSLLLSIERAVPKVQ